MVKCQKLEKVEGEKGQSNNALKAFGRSLFRSPVSDLCILEQENKYVATPTYMSDLILWSGWTLMLKRDQPDKTDWTITIKSSWEPCPAS